MKQHGKFWLSVGLLLLILPAEVFGQSPGCTAKELDAALPPDAQIYRDAMALSKVLSMNGVLVNCVMNSTMEGMFEGESGAATYRSGHGNFEVVFLYQPGAFDRLKILEQRKGERFSYRFKGPPQPWPANLIDSAHPIYFIKNRNMLFVVENDAELAATLQKFARSQR